MSPGGRVAISGSTFLVGAMLTGVALLPASGIDTQPPVCWARVGYEVPCNSMPSWIAVLGGGALAAAVTWRLLKSKTQASTSSQ